MRLIFVLTLAAALGHAAPRDDVRRVLDAQTAAWNKKDLEGYMAGYWKSSELSFYGGTHVTRGWQATLDRYRKKYQAEGKEMGTLSFDELTLELLGDGAALARGRWHLQFSDGKRADGLFTVIFRKLPEGWRIVHDHSC
jgi:beta-aspartyl-peptidase (threonine type)